MLTFQEIHTALNMRSDVLKPVAMKITFFWDVMSYNVIYRYEHSASFLYPEHIGSIFPRNIERQICHKRRCKKPEP
jgi:hypothetical protein